MTSVVAAWTRLIAIGPTPTGALATLLTWWAILGLLPAVFVLFPTVGARLPRRAPARPALEIAVRLGGSRPGRRPRPANDRPGCQRRGEDPLISPFAIPGLPAVIGEVGAALAIVAVLVAFVLALGSVVVRFRRSSGVERAQVKWLVCGHRPDVGNLFPSPTSWRSGPRDSLTSRQSSSGASSRSRSASRSCATASTTSTASSAARCRGRS